MNKLIYNIIKLEMNNKLLNLFKADQADRTSAKIKSYGNTMEGWKLVTKRDTTRRRKVEEILKMGMKDLSSEDYFHAAMVFQHGQKEKDYKMAVNLAKRSTELGYEKAKWLYAAAQDRLLVNLGRKQKYGTQYQKRDGRWILMPVNKKTTDTQRLKFNVMILRKAYTMAKKMNKDRY